MTLSTADEDEQCAREIVTRVTRKVSNFPEALEAVRKVAPNEDNSVLTRAANTLLWQPSR